jgi:hypothetical protein
MPLLLEMSVLQYGVLLLGIVFDVVIILFITISILLIYSLLMVSVETKTFENGVLRMVGISITDCVSCIFYQSSVFVVPSLIFAYLMAIVVDYIVYHILFSTDMGIQVKIIPDSYATIQAFFVGLFIPLVSSIVPI